MRRGIICLIVTFLSYLINSFGLYINNYFIFITGSILGGMAVGGASVAQAAIVDNSSEENVMKNLGYSIIFGASGFVSGSVVSSFFSTDKNHIMPFLIA